MFNKSFKLNQRKIRSLTQVNFPVVLQSLNCANDLVTNITYKFIFLRVIIF